MSFNSFSPELLMELFSHILEVPSKVRLQQVSKKWRDCINNPESWKYNTKLTVGPLLSPEELRSLLSRTKIITNFTFRGGVGAEILGLLLAFGDKLKVKSCTYFPDDARGCHKNNLVLACLLGKFSGSLKTANLTCCVDKRANCDTLETFAKVLPLCTNLKHLTLNKVPDSIDDDNGEPLFLLRSLKHLSLETLHLNDFITPADGQELAAVFNTAKDYSLSALAIECSQEVHDILMFNLEELCQCLEPAAAQSIKTLKLRNVDCYWMEVLPTLPLVMPNLEFLAMDDITYSESADDAIKMAHALGSFSHACLGLGHPIQLQLALYSESLEFKKRLWNAVDLLELTRSGTKRGWQEMQEWKRTLISGFCTVKIDVSM